MGFGEIYPTVIIVLYVTFIHSSTHIKPKLSFSNFSLNLSCIESTILLLIQKVKFIFYFEKHVENYFPK